MTTNLGTFEGLEVRSVTMRIVGAGDGLSSALALDPMRLAHGDRVTVILDCEVTDVMHPVTRNSDGDIDGVTRVHKLKASGGFIADPTLDQQLAAHLEDVARRTEETAGIHRLPIDPDEG
jgi:hypothetical protein